MPVSWEKARELQNEYLRQVAWHQTEFDRWNALAREAADPAEHAGHERAAARCLEAVAHAKGLADSMHAEMNALQRDTIAQALQDAKQKKLDDDRERDDDDRDPTH